MCQIWVGHGGYKSEGEIKSLFSEGGNLFINGVSTGYCGGIDKGPLTVLQEKRPGG